MMADQIKVVRPPRATRKSSPQPWHSYLTIDVVFAAANKTFLHPFVAWMVPLCLRTVMVPYDNISMILAVGWASFLTLLWVLSVFNKRIAYGVPREVNYDEEVIIITGGASGLGRLIADFYAMRGSTVAVLDVKRPKDDEMMGIEFFECDVSNSDRVEETIQNLNQSVCSKLIPLSSLILCSCALPSSARPLS
jgi:hypothetical protein